MCVTENAPRCFWPWTKQAWTGFAVLGRATRGALLALASMAESEPSSPTLRRQRSKHSRALATIASFVSRPILDSKRAKARRIKLAKQRAGEAHVLEAAKIRAFLRKREAATRFIIMPPNSRFIGYWDVVTGVALLYTALLTPVEVSFLPSVSGLDALRSPFFFINRALDTIFTCDMVLNFFVAYEFTSHDTGARYWVTDSRRVIYHYLSTWFSLDFLTISLPLFFDLLTIFGGSNGALSNMSILRVMRVLRLFKLARLVKASRLMRRMASRVSISHATLTMIQCCVILLLSAHWYACCMALQASLHPDPQRTFMGENYYNLCVPSAPGATPDQFGPLAGCEGLSLGTFYMSSFSWSIMVITGTGGTDFYPSIESPTETFIVTALVIVGALLWTQILAMFCDVATNGDPGMTLFRQTLDDMNSFIRDYDIPTTLQLRLREYLHHQKDVQLRVQSARAIPMLSPALQVEVIMHCHRHWLDSIWFIRDMEASCKVRLAMSMESHVLAPGEVAAGRQLYVLSRGLVLYGGRVLSSGKTWGEDIILHNQANSLPFVARAMTYVDLLCIHRDKFVAILSFFPKSYQVMRRCAANLALRRVLIRWAKLFVERYSPGNDKLDGPQPRGIGAPKSDFMVRMQTAADKAQAQADIDAIEMMQLHKQASCTCTNGGGGAMQLSRGSSIQKLKDISGMKAASPMAKAIGMPPNASHRPGPRTASDGHHGGDVRTPDPSPRLASDDEVGGRSVQRGAVASPRASSIESSDELRREVAGLRELSQSLCSALISIETRLGKASSSTAEAVRDVLRDASDSDEVVAERIEQVSAVRQGGTGCMPSEQQEAVQRLSRAGPSGRRQPAVAPRLSC